MPRRSLSFRMHTGSFYGQLCYNKYIHPSIHTRGVKGRSVSMATPTGSPSSNITSELKLDLLKEGSSFSFFQVMRLLHFMCQRFPGNEATGTLDPDSIRVRPKLSLAFPAADVDRIDETSDEQRIRFQVTANFLGLYGTSSPLPTFSTTSISTTSHSGAA